MNARYLTRAAEITGNHEITVDATFTRNGENSAECRGCGDKYSIHLYDSKTREWAQAHAETCRAMPATQDSEEHQMADFEAVDQAEYQRFMAETDPR